MGHTDVVPVNPDGWSRDPFGGEIVDGFVWGRGAVDMLNITASQAVAFRRLAESGFTPKGTLIYLAVADEEALGTWGELVDRARARRGLRRLRAHGVGRLPDADAGRRASARARRGEGHVLVKLRISGTPGHGSQPFRTDNALVTAAGDRAAHPAVRARDPDHRHLAWLRRRHELPRRDPFVVPRSGGLRERSQSFRWGCRGSCTRARTRPSRRRSCTAARRRT